MPKIVFGLIVALTVLLFPAAAQADTASDEGLFVAKINALRASKGLTALQVNGELVAKAGAWSAQMAAAGRIWHSTLSDGISQEWKKLGENVGMGGTVDALHNAFVASPHHYENLVDPAFGAVGIGIVMNGNTMFVSQVFMQLMPPATAPATPITTATTATSTGTPAAASPRPAAPKPAARPAAAAVKVPAPPSGALEVNTVPAPPDRSPSPLLVSVLERLRTFGS